MHIGKGSGTSQLIAAMESAINCQRAFLSGFRNPLWEAWARAAVHIRKELPILVHVSSIRSESHEYGHLLNHFLSKIGTAVPFRHILDPTLKGIPCLSFSCSTISLKWPQYPSSDKTIKAYSSVGYLLLTWTKQFRQQILHQHDSSCDIFVSF